MLSLPLHPTVKNMIIMLSSGVVAALLASNVYGATLALDESDGGQVVASSAAPAKADDKAAAAALRAMLAGQRPLMGTVPADDKRR